MAIELIKDPDARNDPPRPLLAHLTALRDALVFAAVAWAVSFIVAAVFSPAIFAWLKAPAMQYAESIEGLDLTSGFSAAMSIGVWGGTALSFPFLAYALLRFVFPALTRREKVVLLAILVFGSALFAAGVALAYEKTLPLVVSTLQSINGWVGLPVETIRIEGYISIILKTIILTPPDPMSQIAMAVPLCLLYELSIVLVWLRERMR